MASDTHTISALVSRLEVRGSEQLHSGERCVPMPLGGTIAASEGCPRLPDAATGNQCP